jgi:hypothetical protein
MQLEVARGYGFKNGALMGIPVYFWGSHTARQTGSLLKRVECVDCSHVFGYQLTRTGVGYGHAPLTLGGEGAAKIAGIRANNELHDALKQGVDPVPCPRCGIFQPDMVQLLRERHGKRYDPNRYASERISVPARKAWADAKAQNTVQAYRRFKEVWPMYGGHADRSISLVRYPPFLRKFLDWKVESEFVDWFVGRLGIIAWCAIIAFFSIFVIATMIESYIKTP